MRPGQIMRTDPQDAPAARIVPNPFIRAVGESNERLQKSRPWRGDARGIVLPDEPVRVEIRSGPRNLDSGLSGISIVFQAAVPKPVVPKYTTSGVRRPSEL